METFWEYVYDGVILALKVTVALVIVQAVCTLYEVDFNIPIITTVIDFIFHALRIR